MIAICTMVGFAFRSLTKNKVSEPNVDSGVNSSEISSYTPMQVLKAFGGEIVETHENGGYVVAYQGGYFLFSFMEHSEWVDIHFLDFDSMKPGSVVSGHTMH